MADRSTRRPRVGPPDDELLALAAAGLSLRQIAERTGLSHETVRLRRREAVEAAGAGRSSTLA